MTRTLVLFAFTNVLWLAVSGMLLVQVHQADQRVDQAIAVASQFEAASNKFEAAYKSVSDTASGCIDSLNRYVGGERAK